MILVPWERACSARTGVLYTSQHRPRLGPETREPSVQTSCYISAQGKHRDSRLNTDLISRSHNPEHLVYSPSDLTPIQPSHATRPLPPTPRKLSTHEIEQTDLLSHIYFQK